MDWYLGVFGCDAYAHVPKQKRTKLDNKSERFIFIGYKDGLKGYKLWNPEIRKVPWEVAKPLPFHRTSAAKHPNSR